MKQETLEEAAKSKYGIGYGAVDSINAFIEGAKWQQERMYSEEDMRNAYKKVVGEELNEYELKLIQWFEQFKNK